MINQAHASTLASKGLDLWEAGQPEQAIPLYQEAILLADPEHFATPQYHGELAGVFSKLCRFAEARTHYQLSLDIQRRQDQSDASSAVVIARYFLAEHFLHTHEPARAIDAIAPSLIQGISQEWLLRYVKAIALHALGHTEEACTEAHASLNLVPSDERREHLSALFKEEQVL